MEHNNLIINNYMVCSQTFKATQIVITEIRLILNLEIKDEGKWIAAA